MLATTPFCPLMDQSHRLSLCENTMFGAEASLEAIMSQSPWQQQSLDVLESSSSSTSGDSLPHFPSFLCSLDTLDTFDTVFHDPLQAYLGEPAQDSVSSLPQPPPTHQESGADVGHTNPTYTNLLPNIPGINANSAFPPAHNDFPEPSKDETEKLRRKQWKAEMRKERNKAAARRSNLNKKLMRDKLQKRSLELKEENLQLHQDIQTLTQKLRHIQQVCKSMHHVCQRPSAVP